MKLRIVQRTRDRVIGDSTEELDDGELEFAAGPTQPVGEESPGILDDCRRERLILQDFRPLPESLEWELSRLFWQARGAQAFLGGTVPFRVTNDGNLSRKAASVLFESLMAAEEGGELESEIRVLELGAGTGLFARYFLDSFEELCRTQGRDYHERLLYVVTDSSSRMRSDIVRHGLLSKHERRFRVEHADSEVPGFGLDEATSTADAVQAGFRAIFLNYLLDSLPATVLKIERGELQQLFIRTSLVQGVDLSVHTSLSSDDIVGCAGSTNPAERAKLLDLYPLLTLEHEFRPVSPGSIPFFASAIEMAGPDEGVVLHNHGALLCLERALDQLAPGGFALVNDYDDSPFDEFTQSNRYQHFGGSVAMGLNVGLLRRHFESRKDCRWIEARRGRGPLASCLLARNPAPASVRSFRRQFSPAAHEWHHSPIERARSFAKEGRREAALAAFRQALRRQPKNWALLSEAAEFLLFTVRDYPTALRLSEAGLELNPVSPALWNTQGDSLYYLGREAEAHTSFRRALECDPEDVRARFNLSFTLVRRHEMAAGLSAIGEALALDRTGRYRERLLQRQAEILDQLTRAREIERRCLADRWLPTQE